MPKMKMKTRKSVAKRFKITATGKIIRRSSNNAHAYSKKSGSQQRRLDLPKEVKGRFAKYIRNLLGIGVKKK